MGGSVSYTGLPDGEQTRKGVAAAGRAATRLGADPHEHVDPFTHRLNMSVLDWAKVCKWKLEAVALVIATSIAI